MKEEIDKLLAQPIFDYTTTWILIVVAMYFIMVKPLLEDSNVYCAYRDDCVIAKMLWAFLIIVLCYYYGF